ncbi:NAD(P)/FAD-dependent oxidoreductase [Delftia acidovorans]
MTPAQHAQGHAVIIGAGHAGGTLAALLRQYGHPGPITLVGGEDLPPYQRPPLSKAWLQQPMGPDDLLLRPASAYADQAIALRLGVRAMAIEPGSRQVALNDGSALHYDQLVIATGAAPRWLALPGGERPGVTYLRTMEDAQALRGHLQTARCLAIIGGGYVGLEVASTARKLGVQVRVIEREGRLLSRSASPQMAAHLHGLHAGQGVEVHFNASVTAIQGDSPTGITGLRMADGSRLECDAVLIGVGAAPSVELAQSLGLDCAGGIAVDGEGRTAMAGIYAIGDATRRPLAGYPGLHRLESVPSALEQARRAACAITGRALPAHEAPWFWSDQYDTKLQIAGLPGHGDQTVLRGDPASGRFAVLHLRGGQLCAAECVNSPGEFMAARKAIAATHCAAPGFPPLPPKAPPTP